MGKGFPELTARGMATLKVLEGEVPYIYDDAVFPTRPWKVGSRVQGNLTAGVGHLLSPAEILRWGNERIPAEQITLWLDADTDSAERTVHTLTKVPLRDYQRDALIHFTFNVGNAAFAGSTLLRKLNLGDYAAVPTELAKWNKTTINNKKVTSKGLIKRRADEIAYWLSGSAATPGVAPMPTGTQIGERESKETSPLEWLSGAGAVLAPAAGFATGTGPVQWAFGIALVVGVLLIGSIIVKRQFFSA